MSQTLIALDVGASRTRLRVGQEPADFQRTQEPLIREIGSVSALTRLLEEVLGNVPRSGPVYLSAGIAAPNVGSRDREMTNWAEDRILSTDALIALGFEDVLLLNDLEAAAHGLNAFLDGQPSKDEIIAFDGAEIPAHGNRVLVIPGSGLGSAATVDLGSESDHRWHVIPAELGHARASGTEQDPLLRKLAEQKGRHPTWEDCVSGPGLESLWVAGGDFADDAISAPEIALRAQRGDRRAADALHHYYLFAGRFSQLMALAHLSLGGVYLAGGTTRSNAPLIPEEGFLRVFRDNPIMAGVLEQIPVFLVLAEINLLGAWTQGWRRFRARHAAP